MSEPDFEELMGDDLEESILEIKNLKKQLSASEHRNRELLEALEWVLRGDEVHIKFMGREYQNAQKQEIHLPRISFESKLKTLQSAMKEKVK